MNRLELENKIVKLVADLVSVSVEDVKMDSSFVNDLSFDSLDGVELIMTVEDEFNIDITDREAENIMTVGSLVDHVENKLN